MNLKDKTGIYQILCLNSGKRYIGCSIQLSIRRFSHFYELRRNNHVCKPMQQLYNQSGPDSFQFIPLKFMRYKKQRGISLRYQITHMLREESIAMAVCPRELLLNTNGWLPNLHDVSYAKIREWKALLAIQNSTLRANSQNALQEITSPHGMPIEAEVQLLKEAAYELTKYSPCPR